MSNTVCYIGDQPLNLDTTSISASDAGYVFNATPVYPQTFSCSTDPIELSSRVFRLIYRLALQGQLAWQQRNLLALHPHHAEKLDRCLHYRDNLPRKYRRMYGVYFKLIKKNRHEKI